jgi:hypothetical protein
MAARPATSGGMYLKGTSVVSELQATRQLENRKKPMLLFQKAIRPQVGMSITGCIKFASLGAGNAELRVRFVTEKASFRFFNMFHTQQ